MSGELFIFPGRRCAGSLNTHGDQVYGSPTCWALGSPSPTPSSSSLTSRPSPPAVPHPFGPLLPLEEACVAQFAHPLGLAAVDVGKHGLLLGARRAHQETAVPAVVAALDEGELVGTSHAHGRHMVWDPGGGVGLEGGAVLASGGALQQAFAALDDALHPGAFFLGGAGRHVEGLARRADQPVVLHWWAVLVVLQLDVLYNHNIDLYYLKSF